MKYFEVELKKVYTALPETQYNPLLLAYISDRVQYIDPGRKVPAIIILPGGGYANTSERESEQVALEFMSKGMAAFVLKYSIITEKFPQQLLEVSAAVSYIREHSEELRVDPNKIAVMGFSAGGHLTASLATMWREPFIYETLGIPFDSNRPNATLLSYAFTSGKVIEGRDMQAIERTLDVILGDQKEQMRENVSLENHVKPYTPPTFMWHTYNDTAVPIEDCLMYANALRANNVPFELHIFHEGVHGLSLCDKRSTSNEDARNINPHCAAWIDLAHNWLKQIFK